MNTDLIEQIERELADLKEAMEKDDFEKARVKVEDMESSLEEITNYIDETENYYIEG